MSDLTRLGVLEAAEALRARSTSASELAAAHLARIRERDGVHSHDGDPASVNAWVRVYEEDAVEAARAADERLSDASQRASGPPPTLTGIPIGLKDLFGVAGKPVTASSRVLADVPTEDCDVWKQLKAAGMVLLGHLHTHEFAAGGTTDQVGSPWDLARSSGGSSGGSAAAVAARTTPAATGTDTAGSLRIPSACCGTSTIKPTHGLVSMAGVVPLSESLDHAGPIARSLVDCRLLLEVMARPDRPTAPDALGPLDGPLPLTGMRVAISPRTATAELDADVAAGFEHAVEACRRLGATVVGPPPPPPDVTPDVGEDFLDVLTTDMRRYHRRFDIMRDRYRPSTREWVEMGEQRAVTPERYREALGRRRQQTNAWSDWIALHRVAAVIEPTIPTVAPLRGWGYDHAGSDYALISLTHLWDWTGLPVAALPAGLGRGGLPVGVSLIGRLDSDWNLLSIGSALQRELGVPEPPE